MQAVEAVTGRPMVQVRAVVPARMLLIRVWMQAVTVTGMQRTAEAVRMEAQHPAMVRFHVLSLLDFQLIRVKCAQAVILN